MGDLGRCEVAPTRPSRWKRCARSATRSKKAQTVLLVRGASELVGRDFAEVFEDSASPWSARANVDAPQPQRTVDVQYSGHPSEPGQVRSPRRRCRCDTEPLEKSWRPRRGRPCEHEPQPRAKNVVLDGVLSVRAPEAASRRPLVRSFVPVLHSPASWPTASPGQEGCPRNLRFRSPKGFERVRQGACRERANSRPPEFFLVEGEVGLQVERRREFPVELGLQLRDPLSFASPVSAMEPELSNGGLESSRCCRMPACTQPRRVRSSFQPKGERFRIPYLRPVKAREMTDNGAFFERDSA